MNSNKENSQEAQVIYTLPARMEKVVSDKSKELAVSPQEALEVIVREWMLTVWVSGERPSRESLFLSYLDERLDAIDYRLEYHQEALETLWMKSTP